MDKNKLGYQLAYCRRKEELSQEEFAEIVNCSPCTISRIENGKEYPRVELFERINYHFPHWGVNGPDIYMDDISELHKAKYELLVAIHVGRAERLVRAIRKFGNLMDENNIEHQQYYTMGAVVYMKTQGMTTEEYIRRCEDVFKLRRDIPDNNDMPKLKLTRIEHMILFQYAMAKFDVGASEEAEGILVALIKNCFEYTSEYHKRRCKSISTNVARVFYHQKEYNKAQKCVSYVLGRFADANDVRLMFQILNLQQEIFKILEDSKGEKVIDEFLIAAANMINYLYKHLYGNDK
jgi:transcriptional regulator with XRE-family HTH domain